MSDGSEREVQVASEAFDDEADGTEYGAAVRQPSERALREEGPARAGSGFDPSPYIRQLRGRGGGDYLDVKWRLLWLRKEHPDAAIETELVQHDPQMAIFKATVTLPTGGKATGYGSETASDFPDFIEKAETKAIGRALNALGYGAQFSERPDEPAPERERQRPEAQAPRPAPRPVPLRRQEPSEAAPATPPPPAAQRAPASPTPTGDADLADYSWSAFWPWARERGLNGPREIATLIGQEVAGLSPAELRDLIIAADARR